MGQHPGLLCTDALIRFGAKVIQEPWLINYLEKNTWCQRSADRQLFIKMHDFLQKSIFLLDPNKQLYLKNSKKLTITSCFHQKKHLTQSPVQFDTKYVAFVSFYASFYFGKTRSNKTAVNSYDEMNLSLPKRRESTFRSIL